MKNLLRYLPVSNHLIYHFAKNMRKEPHTGYCSNCGVDGQHSFHELAATWQKLAVMNLIMPGIVLIPTFIGPSVRDIYKCQSCEHLTLLCRAPGCTGMARTGD